MSETFNYPPPDPLYRLNVRDNLAINAERWLLAHNYHRQRQSLNYQSLCEPGIVHGLGVKVIEAPAQSRFKDGRWLAVQSGVAIDNQGNFIIVGAEQDRTYRLALPAPQQAPTTVYLIVKYVDPDTLELPEQKERVPEQFRIDETTQLPNPNLGEVELCRIHLAVGEIRLETPVNPLRPQTGQPNLRHRMAAKMRSQHYLRIGLLRPQPNVVQQNFSHLAAALPAFYPTLQANIEPIESFSALSVYGLIYLQLNQLSALGRVAQQALQQYVAKGGTLLFEGQTPDEISRLSTELSQLWPQSNLQPVDPLHELVTQPFLFGRLPTVNQGEIMLYQGDGLILTSPPLSSAWGDRQIARSDIRSAQELGANLLQFAWQRQRLYQLLQ